MKIDDKEFEPDGWFGLRGLGGKNGRAVIGERAYVRFEKGDAGAVIDADDRLGKDGVRGWTEWLVAGSGGYVIQKHAVPGEDTDPNVQIRPDIAPVTEVVYHDHAGMEHKRGTGCSCGAKRHAKARTDRPYSDVERAAHEGGRAHTEHPELRDRIDDAALLELGARVVASLPWPHRHLEEGKYMLSPNRDRQSRPHTHRIFLRGHKPRADILTILVNNRGIRSREIAERLGIEEDEVAEERSQVRGLVLHIRRPLDHPYGGHGGECDYGLDDEHDHDREVKSSLQEVLVDFPAHPDHKDHGQRFKDGEGKRDHRRGKDGRVLFDRACRKCTADRHLHREHDALGIVARKPHQHLGMESVPLPSTEKRLDMHPRSRKRVEDGERPARVFFSIEGTAKCDALVTRGEVAFDVPSVTMWRSEPRTPSRENRGRLPELDEFARSYLTDSVVFVCPDSDWASNPAVSLQAFECREYLRRILGELEVHVAAAPPKCGDVCTHTGQKRKDDKNGIDDWIGQGHSVDELLVLDRHQHTGWFDAWETAYTNEHRPDRAKTDVGIMKWLCLHATENAVKDHPTAGHVKRSVTSIQEYLARNGWRVTTKAIENAFHRLLDEGVLETVPPEVGSAGLKKIAKVRRSSGGRPLYLGEDWGDGEGNPGITFRIHPALRWSDTRTPIGEMMAELAAFKAAEKRAAKSRGLGAYLAEILRPEAAEKGL